MVNLQLFAVTKATTQYIKDFVYNQMHLLKQNTILKLFL